MGYKCVWRVKKANKIELTGNSKVINLLSTLYSMFFSDDDFCVLKFPSLSVILFFFFFSLSLMHQTYRHFASVK